MAVPTTQKQWKVQGVKNGFEELKYEDAPVPQIGDHDVLVRMRGASLNYRDLIIPQGLYPFPLDVPVVGGSDGAGEVVAVGPKVTKWAPGDKVVTLFNQDHQHGPMTKEASKSGLGGVLDGTLRQYGAFQDTGLVRMPDNLNFPEAAALTCAGLTAWNALYGLKPLKPGETVLTQGTGGVSLFALQFAKAAGARVIATTSSADKAKMLKDLGADHVINYREDPNWGETARKLTPEGRGCEHVVEVAGAATMGQSFKAVRFEGIVSIIGFLGGAQPKESVLDTLSGVFTVRGVYVGPRSQMEDMCAAVEANNIRPVMDRQEFTLEKVKEAYEYMWAQRHVGKIPIRIE